MSWPISDGRGREDPRRNSSHDDILPRHPHSRPSSSHPRDTNNGQHEFAPHDSGLVVSDVQVRLVDNERLRAWATITLNGSFVIKGIRVIQGNTRLFVAMPSKQQKDGNYQDIAHPITPDFRDYLERCVLQVHNQVEEQGGERMPRMSRNHEDLRDLADHEEF